MSNLKSYYLEMTFELLIVFIKKMTISMSSHSHLCVLILLGSPKFRTDEKGHEL